MADLGDVEPGLREALVDTLIAEAEEMTDREIAFLLLDAMDEDELSQRVKEMGRMGFVQHH